VELLVIALGVVAVFVLALVAVGRVSASLARDPHRMIYDVEQSLEFVAEALPSEVTAELSYDDVSVILRFFHDYMHEMGVSTTAGEDEARPGPAVVDLDTGVHQVIARAALADVHYRQSDVEAVVSAQMEYFAAIGVLGTPVEGPDLDDL